MDFNEIAHIEARHAIDLKYVSFLHQSSFKWAVLHNQINPLRSENAKNDLHFLTSYFFPLMDTDLILAIYKEE